MSAPEAPEAPAAPDVAEAPSAPEAADGTIDRPIDLRLTRLHLRMGSLELARAELEAIAGGSELDTDALIDLAEVRWRTGDLPGAGVAANAYLAADRDDVLALVIAAEASAAANHPGEARQLVARVIGREGLDLDAVFAGMPRSWMWPLEPTDRPLATTELFPDAPRPMAEAALAAPEAWAPTPTAAVGGTRSVAEIDTAASRPPEPVEPAGAPVELAAARSALDAGDPLAAADRLGSLLRSRPDLAATILDALERAAPTAAGSSDANVDPGSAPGDPARHDPPPGDPPARSGPRVEF